MIKPLSGFLLSDVKTNDRIAFVQLKSEAITRGKRVLMELSALTWNAETWRMAGVLNGLDNRMDCPLVESATCASLGTVCVYHNV